MIEKVRQRLPLKLEEERRETLDFSVISASAFQIHKIVGSEKWDKGS
jgi:hypothetical protein